MKRGFLLLAMLLTFLMTPFGKAVSTVNTETIYTSLPNPNDRYYQPFTQNFHTFNTSLQRHATGRDNFQALTPAATDFKTTDFDYPDIWIRDVAPVITSRMVKFVYSPHYLKRIDSHYLNRRFTKFLKSRYAYHQSQLVLDGGNVQWNGGDTVIMTKQVLKDNSTWSRQAIVDELKWQLKVKHVILISPEPGDILGHSDGMVTFIGRHTLFINDFSYEPGFRQKIEDQIRAVDPTMKFIVLPSSYTDQGQYDSKIASARGLYVNMLKTPNAIYFPQYGLKNDAKALAIVRVHTDKPVIPINVAKLSTLGGSVHCLTWEAPGKFEK